MTFSDGFPPFYATRPTSAFYDVTQAYLVYTAISLFIGVLLVLPGLRGKDRKYFIIRWIIALFTGSSIIACIFGLSWHEAVRTTILPNRAQNYTLARFEVGLHIGLASFNVTFKEVGENARKSSIDYNEDFYFLQTDAALTRGLRRGLPAPILDVAEFFTTESVAAMNAWGRRYYIAGRYAKYMLWFAFGIWVVGNVVLSTFVKYGGLNRILVGFLLLAANVSFATVNMQCCELEIRLGYINQITLIPTYGWSFWLCMCVGLISIISGSVITLSSYFCLDWILNFFDQEKEVEEPFLLDVDKTPISSRQSSSSQLVKEAHTSKNGVESVSSKDVSRRGSLQKMEFISMDTDDKHSASNVNQPTAASEDYGASAEESLEVKMLKTNEGFTSTDL